MTLDQQIKEAQKEHHKHDGVKHGDDVICPTCVVVAIIVTNTRKATLDEVREELEKEKDDEDWTDIDMRAGFLTGIDRIIAILATLQEGKGNQTDE